MHCEGKNVVWNWETRNEKVERPVRRLLLSSLSLKINKILKKRFYWFIFRERGREGERKGEKHQCVVASCPPYWGSGLQPKHVPWLGIKPVTLWFSGQHSIHWATQAWSIYLIFTINLWGRDIIAPSYGWDKWDTVRLTCPRSQLRNGGAGFEQVVLAPPSIFPTTMLCCFKLYYDSFFNDNILMSPHPPPPAVCSSHFYLLNYYVQTFRDSKLLLKDSDNVFFVSYWILVPSKTVFNT